jgi:ectoine hydroxylase-related dioxygenase (phytanoyl-CoA dioxygenase family)
MKYNSPLPATQRAVWFREEACSVAEFAALLEPAGEAGGVGKPLLAASVEQGIPLYDCTALRTTLNDTAERSSLLGEWVDVLHRGAGVLILQGAYADTSPIDEATTVFESIIAKEREAGVSGADHFAKAGANDRIWNALEKLCLCNPEVFARYYANPFVAAISEAWLGPHYQMTSQINVVRPGGAAQLAHRDYHLGFQTIEASQQYPAHVHLMSPFLTLQGAIAHCDMPVESGPTKLLPFSQRYAPGYLAWRRQDFRDYFEAHCVQLPLKKGDALFFSPALFHAAGSNRTASVSRMANLLQVSSAYGRAMESVDRTRMCEVLYPVLLALGDGTRMNRGALDAVIASSAEGYPFPTNLDRDPPAGGLAPASQQALLRQALDEQWPTPRFVETLRARDRARSTE